MFKVFNRNYERARSAICQQLKAKASQIEWSSGSDIYGNWIRGYYNGQFSNKEYY